MTVFQIQSALEKLNIMASTVHQVNGRLMQATINNKIAPEDFARISADVDLLRKDLIEMVDRFRVYFARVAPHLEPEKSAS